MCLSARLVIMLSHAACQGEVSQVSSPAFPDIFGNVDKMNNEELKNILRQLQKLSTEKVNVSGAKAVLQARVKAVRDRLSPEVYDL